MIWQFMAIYGDFIDSLETNIKLTDQECRNIAINYPFSYSQIRPAFKRKIIKRKNLMNEYYSSFYGN